MVYVILSEFLQGIPYELCFNNNNYKHWLNFENKKNIIYLRSSIRTVILREKFVDMNPILKKY